MRNYIKIAKLIADNELSDAMKEMLSVSEKKGGNVHDEAVLISMDLCHLEYETLNDRDRDLGDTCPPH